MPYYIEGPVAPRPSPGRQIQPRWTGGPCGYDSPSEGTLRDGGVFGGRLARRACTVRSDPSRMGNRRRCRLRHRGSRNVLRHKLNKRHPLEVGRHSYTIRLRLLSYTPALWTGLLWFALLAAAGLCYPRRPRTAGAFFIMLGVLSAALSFRGGAGLGAATFVGLIWFSLGLSWLMRFRNPDIRAKHVEYWTAKA